MALPPGGCGDAAGRSLLTLFLTKTFQLVEDKTIDHLISWNQDGSTFIVWNQTDFAKDFLSKYFMHTNFSSFVRQLNTYGFRKVVPDRWEFSNDCFRRGETRLLCDIQRRKITTLVTHTLFASGSGEEQVLSSSTSSRGVVATNLSSVKTATKAELVGEDERLKRENVKLNKELSHMKHLCSNICVMMSNYATLKPPQQQALDLLPLKRLADDYECFGGNVTSGAIGLKWLKDGGLLNDLLQLQQPGS